MKASGRVVLRVMCNRPAGPKQSAHTLGLLSVAPDGTKFVTFRIAVRESAGFRGGQVTWPLSHVEGALAHCADCRKQFPISDLVLADAVKQGLRSLVVEPIGFLLNPIGVLSKRHPHVAERIERLHRHSAGMLPDKTSPTAG